MFIVERSSINSVNASSIEVEVFAVITWSGPDRPDGSTET